MQKQKYTKKKKKEKREERFRRYTQPIAIQLNANANTKLVAVI